MTFTLDLLRHGAAAEDDGGGDFQRPLTDEGRAVIQRLAERLISEVARPTLVFASPLARARETAELVTSRLGLERAVELEELGVEGGPEEVLRAVASVAPEGRHVLLVGHQPQMGNLAFHLTGRQTPFSPGTLVRIALEGTLGARTGRTLLTFGPHR